MATYRSIATTETDPEAPLTSQLVKALEANPRAIAEGAPGAPRIEFPAMSTSFSSAGQIGSMAMLGAESAILGSASPGDVVSGALLRYAGVSTDSVGATQVVITGSAPAGNWRCMGLLAPFAGASGGTTNATMFIRIS